VRRAELGLTAGAAAWRAFVSSGWIGSETDEWFALAEARYALRSGVSLLAKLRRARRTPLGGAEPEVLVDALIGVSAGFAVSTTK